MNKGSYARRNHFLVGYRTDRANDLSSLPDVLHQFEERVQADGSGVLEKVVESWRVEDPSLAPPS
jgi:predicted ester cyclase